MAIINFKKESQDKLSFILGSVETEEDTNRGSFVDSYVEKNYYKVTEAVIVEVEGEDDTTEYKATQVNPDGSVEENGIVFDSDETYTSNVNSPLYLPNLKINTTLFSGDVEVGKAYQVEEIDPDEFGEEPVYYIIPKGGGGGGITYGVVSSVSEDLADHYNITLYDSRTNIGNADPNNTVILNMTSLSSYGLLPTNFVLAVNELEDGTYEPFEVQSTCFGVIVSRESIDPEHPNDNYTVTVNTAPYGGGMTLGNVNATVPNVDYGYMSAGAKQTVFFVKENNAWYMNPATFGAY